MKRFHVHVNVNDLDASVRFYSQLFAAEPNVVKADYAKWMLDDPRVNFAISQRDGALGVDHLGVQAETGEELARIGQRLAAADTIALTETGATCCYAQSDKYWAKDPQGLRWETFHTHGEATTYFAPAANAPCCGPRAPALDAGTSMAAPPMADDGRASTVAGAAPCCSGPGVSA